MIEHLTFLTFSTLGIPMAFFTKSVNVKSKIPFIYMDGAQVIIYGIVRRSILSCQTIIKCCVKPHFIRLKNMMSLSLLAGRTVMTVTKCRHNLWYFSTESTHSIWTATARSLPTSYLARPLMDLADSSLAVLNTW